MGESRRYSPNAQLGIEEILVEARHRWLRPVEICGILQNYRNYRLTKEPPCRPRSGSVFLFDRRETRYFRKDGHNWRKKKDGKTVKEAHERLKAGSVDVLHCYYAHGEEKENLQRRSYWMLEEELSSIVFVHYLEVKGNRANFMLSRNADSVPYSSQTEEDEYNNSEVVSSSTSAFQPCYRKGSSQDAESEYKNYSSHGIHTNVDRQLLMKTGAVPVNYHPVRMPNRNYQVPFPATCVNLKSLAHGKITEDFDVRICQNPAQTSNTDYQSVGSMTPSPSTQLNAISINHGHGTELLDHVVSGTMPKNLSSRSHVFDHPAQCKEEFSADEKPSSIMNSLHVDISSSRQTLLDEVCSVPKVANELDLDDLIGMINPRANEQTSNPIQLEFELQAVVAECGSLHRGSESTEISEIDKNRPAVLKPLFKGIQEGLTKVDSFDRWMSKELGDVAEPTRHHSSQAYWGTFGDEDDGSGGIPVQVPVEQLFSIIDFSPNWAFSEAAAKVLIMGRFLRSTEEVRKQKWACMFGEHEVPAEIISDGVLRCHTPFHPSGRVPFYITCSNRLACSEVREFEFRTNSRDLGITNFSETYLHMRFAKLLSLGSSSAATSVESCAPEILQLCSRISTLLIDDNEWEQMLSHQDEQNGKDQLLQKLLKEKLHFWLVQKIYGGNGASVLDEDGQGVLHFAAALGYEWAIAPTVAAGVGINFRDVNGWTALHWASCYGREHMVAFLVSLGADPGMVTDPTANTPGRTPADLASSNGHKGIAGYLAESALSCHVSSLELDSNGIDTTPKARETSANWLVSPVSDGYMAHGSLKESLAAVHNATQAAARIHQVYRIQSFQRKQIMEYGHTQFNDHALSLLSLKSKKTGQTAESAHSAAIRIQKKFRGWKGRKDFLLIRQRIIRIQAVVRGHQVRKHYRKIIWSVRFLDRVILRWRRKGKGLSVSKSSSTDETEDDFDFLKDGRRQSEERLQKALARVKSMVHYPEARDQYGRLLTVVSEMQGMKAAYDRVLWNTEADFDEDLIHLHAVLEDHTFMNTEA